MKKVLVGISGGVDSSVALLLLKKEYDVTGCYMDLLGKENNAKEVCDNLNVNYLKLDYKKEFKEEIINYFINEYKEAKTPNPCIMCNKKFKFGKFYEYAKDNGYDYIATGHYAKVEYSDKYKRYVLKKSDNLLKDQSYFLYNIDKNILPHILFPLSNFKDKQEIRNIAKDNNLNTASISDSQDICFIENDYKTFLEDNGIKKSIGNIIFNNKIIGKHNGLYNYTIGQRKGLGISYENPLYVINFNKENNELIVGEELDLYSKSFKVKDYNLLLIDNLNTMDVNVKIRYSNNEYPCVISMKDNYINVEFKTPQRGVTPGQSAVFYIDDIVVGGGIIQ